MLVENPQIAPLTRPLPAECFLGREEVEPFDIPRAPPAGSPQEALLTWGNAILRMKLNAEETANKVNGDRLAVCQQAAPGGASVIIE